VLAELNRLNELSASLPGSLLGSPGSPGSLGGAGGAGGGGPEGAPVGAAATQQQAVSAQAAAQPAEKPKTLEELLGELDELTGLERVKSEVHRQAQVLRIEQLRAAAKLRSATITRHLVFLGNPGTGKTTVARLVSGIYRAIGLLSKGQLVEVDRSELVAGYLGQTATKTAEVVAKAIGGVLFIDEAYALAGDQYGEEAIDTLVKEMEDHRDDLVVIVAGYPVPMASFIAANPGLASRFRTVIVFDDYTDDELTQIFTRLAADSDYAPTPDCLGRFRELLRATPRGEGFGNGRFARNTLEGAVARQAWRLRDVAEPSVDQLRELLPADLTESDPESDPDPDPESDPDPEARADGQPGTEPGPEESPPQEAAVTPGPCTAGPPPTGPAPASERST
jgi:SpoVK/Ycf46/Vps4 family AAA+-type ATPase